MMFNPSDHTTSVQSIAPDQRGAATVNGASIDTEGFEYVCVRVLVGEIATAATLDVKLQQSSDDGVADAFVDISGSAVTQFTGSSDNTRKSAEQRTRAKERYIRAVGVVAGGNVDYGVILEGFGPKQSPDYITETYQKFS